MKHIFIFILIMITAAIGYTLFVFMSPSHYMQKLDDHVSLSDEWATLTPARPLDIRYRSQELSLRVDNVRDWEVDNEEKPTEFIDPDGNAVEIEAELIGSNGKTYAANNLSISRGITLSTGTNLPENIKVAQVKMRSSQPLKVLSIFWVCYSK